MLEELKDEELINRVGGRFKLTALIQKRLVYLNRGARSFVEPDKQKNKLQIVLQEIKEGKIQLTMDQKLLEHGPEVVANLDGTDFSDLD